MVINSDNVTFVDFFKLDWSLGLGPIYCTPLCLTMVSFKIILKLVLHFDWQKGAAVLDPNDIDVFDILIYESDKKQNFAHLEKCMPFVLRSVWMCFMWSLNLL